MYFPFLRARQFELIAAREFVALPTNHHHIIPIFEPVKDDLKALFRAIRIFEESDNDYVIILNSPFCKLEPNEILDALEVEFELLHHVIYGIHVGSDFWGARNCLGEFDGRAMLLCSNSVDANDPDFEQIIENEKVQVILSPDNRKLKRKSSQLGINFVRWDDNFKKKNRNSDYLTQTEEKFTEEHLYLKDEGYFGFCDYGPLPSEFVEGGSMPYAVAIHLTYKREDGEIWIRHFTSVSNSDQANVQGKFAEAAEKAVTFLDVENIETSAANELRSYYNDQKFPGLGMVKKISIKNHLELINSILN